MINYIYDAIRVGDGGNNYVALTLTGDDGTAVATGNLVLEIKYDDELVATVAATYSSGTWFFEIPELDFNGRGFYRISHNDQYLNFWTPFYREGGCE